MFIYTFCSVNKANDNYFVDKLSLDNSSSVCLRTPIVELDRDIIAINTVYIPRNRTSFYSAEYVTQFSNSTAIKSSYNRRIRSIIEFDQNSLAMIMRKG